MRTLWMSGAAAVMALSIAGVSAQNPPTQTPPTQTPETQRQATSNEATATLRGCVYQEKDVPGRTPNVAERAGILEDYILVLSPDAKSATAGTAGRATGAPAGTTGTMAGGKHAAKAYKLEHAADEQLRSMVGKMVEVTGRIDAERLYTAPGKTPAGAAGATPAEKRDHGLGPDKIELPEFEVTAIRAIEGTCPATPDIKK